MRLFSVLGEPCSLPGPSEARSYRWPCPDPRLCKERGGLTPSRRGGVFPAPLKGQACCGLQEVPLWRTERVRFLFVIVVSYPSKRGLSGDFVPGWADLSFDSDLDHAVPATIRTPWGQGPHWHLYRIGAWARGWDAGSFGSPAREPALGLAGARGGSAGEGAQQLGSISLLETWSPRPRNSGPESEMKLRWTHIPGPGRA